MPTPLAKGIIITVSVLIAAGLAAYESPEIRKWVHHSRQKIAMALHSLGDEISPSIRENKTPDPSMDEEKSDEAEERRRKAREEIMEKARVLEERKRRRSKNKRDSGVGSFDTLVDDNGNLLAKPDGEEAEGTVAAATVATGVMPPAAEGLTRRGGGPAGPSSSSYHAEDKPEQPESFDPTTVLSNYENELRENWNLPLPPITTAASQTSHASESLLDLTPTSEFPDPDFSIPQPGAHSPAQSQSQPQHEGQFFSVPNLPDQEPPADSPLTRSRTISPADNLSESSYYYAHPSHPNQPLPDLPLSNTLQVQSSVQNHNHPEPDRRPTSSVLSVADSSDLEHIRASANDNASVSDLHSIASSRSSSHFGNDFSDINNDDDENGDGVRTPEGSLWTDVGSSVSGED